VEFPDPDLAALLFHELAHRQLYVRDDTTFNESFATAVEEEGLRRWLERSSLGAEGMDSYRARRAAEEELVARVLECRARLAAIYAGAGSREEKVAAKRRLLADLRAGAEDPALGHFGPWLDRELGNAHLASLGEYRGLVPYFQSLLASHRGDLPAFYRAAAAIAALPAAQRPTGPSIARR
jgi:predicted aminopeptidase